MKRRISFYFCRQKYCLQVFLIVLETYSCEMYKILWYKKIGVKISERIHRGQFRDVHKYGICKSEIIFGVTSII